MSPEILLRAIYDAICQTRSIEQTYIDAFMARQQGQLLKIIAHYFQSSTWTGPSSVPVWMPPADVHPDTATLLPLSEYDHILIGFSGGKDSVACVLYLMEQLDALGIEPASKLELWHHCVDGRPGSPALFDWPCTESYCIAFAEALSLPLYRSWREGGFLREMQRENTATAPVAFETPNGEQQTGGKGPAGTRKLFPQVTGDLSVRWCSAYLKIMVASSAITNDPRFERDVKILLITGERRQESPNRARYARAEIHRASAPSKGRMVHQHRPILDWKEEHVWEILRRWGIVPHPCYWLGFGRASCEVCIFSHAAEWATLQAIHPDRVDQLAALEAWTGKTIARKLSVPALVEKGQSFAPDTLVGRWWQKQAVERFDAPVRVQPSGWHLPPGAFRKTAGPL